MRTLPAVAPWPVPETLEFVEGFGELAVDGRSVGAGARVAGRNRVDGDATATTPTATTMARHAAAVARRTEGLAGRDGMCRW